MAKNRKLFAVSADNKKPIKCFVRNLSAKAKIW